MKPEKVYYKNNNDNYYFNIIKSLFKNVKNEDLRKNFSAPFVLFCGTFIEYMLNDLFILHSNKYFENKTQKQYAESFISMSFKSKLTCLLPILTNHKYQIDLNSDLYKSLTEIISKRNKIAHGKDFFTGIIPEKIKKDGSFSIKIGEDELNKNSLDFSLNNCIRYYNNVFVFYNTIYNPYKENKDICLDTNIIKIIENKDKLITLGIDNNYD